jgi:anti-sigma28 factor (negative regulator of flagellin synthesis)
MRIDPNPAIAPATMDTHKTQVPARPPAADQDASVVELSAAAAQTASVTEPSPSITSRIERIRTLLERGAYPIDLDVLASRIVDDDVLRAGRSS